MNEMLYTRKQIFLCLLLPSLSPRSEPPSQICSQLKRINGNNVFVFFIKAEVLAKVPRGESLVTYGGAGKGRQIH